jgi:protein subunit release factor A
MNLKELAPQTTNRLNKVMESRFGFVIDYDNLTYGKAQRLNAAINENLTKIRRGYGIHTAEKNPKYMEMLMVQEGLRSWISQQDHLLTEGELETAEAVLAAKDMVDSIQDMITDASKMMNEELPPLLDTIRDQLGAAQADNFKNTAQGALQGLMDALNVARDSLDQGSRALAGEQVAQPMAMGADLEADLETGFIPADDLEATDDFASADAAAGGEEEFGRERR